MLMGITTCTWIICIVLHDTYPGIEGTGYICQHGVLNSVIYNDRKVKKVNERK